MEWKGKPLKTKGEFCAAMESIVTQEDADEFMRLCEDEGGSRESIGYLTGYFNPETAEKMRALFKVTHPIFGDENPTPDEAFKKGLELGEKARNPE